MKTIEFTISPKGDKVEINAEGFTGGQCKDVTKNVLKALGTVQNEKKKDGFYAQGGAGQSIRG